MKKIFMDGKRMVEGKSLIEGLAEDMIVIGVYDWTNDDGDIMVDDGIIVSESSDLSEVECLIIAKLEAKISEEGIDDFEDLWDKVKEIIPSMKWSFRHVNYNGNYYIYDVDGYGYSDYFAASCDEIDDDMEDSFLFNRILEVNKNENILGIIEKRIKEMYERFYPSSICGSFDIKINPIIRDLSFIDVIVENEGMDYSSEIEISLEENGDSIYIEFDFIE